MVLSDNVQVAILRRGTSDRRCLILAGSCKVLVLLGCAFGLLSSGGVVRGQEAGAEATLIDQSPSSDSYLSSVSLLSDLTQGMVAIDSVPKFTESWRKTSLSQMQQDESLREFFELHQANIEAKMAQMGLRTGIRFRDLADAVSGELVFAWIRFEAPKHPFSIAILADTRGRDGQRNSLLKKMDGELRKRNATVAELEIRGAVNESYKAIVYTMPQKRGQLVVERIVAVDVKGRLIFSDRPETVQALVAAEASGKATGLVASQDYVDVFAQIEKSWEKGEVIAADSPSIKWFARPIGMGMIGRELAGVDRGRQVDILKLLQNQGFDAVKSIGGQLHLATEHYDLLHRGYVLAPPTVSTPERYKLAARILQFPNLEMKDPPSWVLPTAATFLQVSWKMEKAFWATETLVNEAFGVDKFFRQMLDEIRDDEDTQIDIEKDVVANFMEDLYIMSENRIDGEETQERAVSAIRIKNPERVAEVLNKALDGDKDAQLFDYPDHPVWEIRPQPVEKEVFEVDGGNLDFETDEEEEQAERKPLLDRSAITVFDGYLMVSSHPELLVDIIKQSQNPTATLGQDASFQRVTEAMEREGGKSRSFQRIVRTDLSLRIKYQLLREGKFVESDSMLAAILRRLKETNETAETAEPAERAKIDMSKLPAFSEVEKYLQPAGGFVVTEDQGWSTTYFLLRK
jgi:hypothetical protein